MTFHAISLVPLGYLYQPSPISSHTSIALSLALHVHRPLSCTDYNFLFHQHSVQYVPLFGTSLAHRYQSINRFQSLDF